MPRPPAATTARGPNVVNKDHQTLSANPGHSQGIRPDWRANAHRSKQRASRPRGERHRSGLLVVRFECDSRLWLERSLGAKHERGGNWVRSCNVLCNVGARPSSWAGLSPRATVVRQLARMFSRPEPQTFTKFLISAGVFLCLAVFVGPTLALRDDGALLVSRPHIAELTPVGRAELLHRQNVEHDIVGRFAIPFGAVLFAVGLGLRYGAAISTLSDGRLLLTPAGRQGTAAHMV